MGLSFQFSWTPAEKKIPRGSSKAVSVDHDRTGRWSGCCSGCFVSLILGAFLLVVPLSLYAFTIRPLWGVYSARSWEELSCTILSSEVELHRNGDTYRIAITYEYISNGVRHTGDRFHFMNDGYSSGLRGKQAVVDAHPRGLKTVCYVNPHDPKQAILERGLTADMWWGLLPLPFVVFGIVGVVFALRERKRNETSHLGTTRAAITSDTTESEQSLVAPTVSESIGTPKAKTSPMVMFLRTVFLCLFWNGLVSVFVWECVSGHLAGNADWVLTVFLTPFVLIGLVFVAAVPFSFLGLFNPLPELTLSRGRLPLGSVARVDWRFRGNIRSIGRLNLSVEGLEQVTYREGGDAATDQKTFFAHLFYETSDPIHIAQGEAEFEIPGDSMHSLESENNKIMWSLHVAAEVARWPDVDLSFPIQVTPHEPAEH